MVVVDSTTTNSTLGSNEWTWNIFYTFSDVYLALVISVGVSLNSMAMSLLIRFNKVRKTEQSFMLINLIGSELLAAFCLPLDFLGSISRGKIYERYPILCPISGFAHSFFGLNSYFTIVSMAGIRYLSVVHLERSWHIPSRNSFWSSRHVWKVWGIVLTIAVPPLFGFGEYKVDTSTICCTPYWPASTLLGICYNWLLITKGFIIPTILILSSTCLVTKKLREQRNSLSDQDKPKIRRESNDINAEEITDLQQEIKRKRSMQKVLLNAAGFPDSQQESKRRRSMQSVMLNAAGFSVNAEGFVTSQQQNPKSKQRKDKVAKKSNDTYSEAFTDSQKTNTRMKSNKKIESMISMMTLSFYVCWTPYVLRVILDLFGVPLSAIVPVLCLHLAKLRIIINPILYIFFNKEIIAVTAETNSPEGCTRELRSASTQTDDSIASGIGNVVNQVSKTTNTNSTLQDFKTKERDEKNRRKCSK